MGTIVLLSLVVAALQSAPAKGTTMAFETVARGRMSAIDAARQFVVRSDAEWTALWREHAAVTAMPAVDFTTRMVAGVFLGSRPSAGFDVEIVAVRRDGDGTVIEYVERRPPPGAVTAQILTSPFHIVSLPRQQGAVTFARAAEGSQR